MAVKQGYADFILPTALVEQIIEKIKVDITAQTLPELKVDITAQTLATLNVNLAASTITLDVNLAASAITLNVYITGTFGNLPISIEASAITLDVKLVASAITLDVNIASSVVTLNVSVVGTASISIDDATIKVAALHLLDIGVLKRIHFSAQNQRVTLYTVPAGKAYYIFSWDLNARHYAAGIHYCWLEVFDGTNYYWVAVLEGTDADNHLHTQGTFTAFKIPAGWSIRLYANAYTLARVAIIGVETGA